MAKLRWVWAVLITFLATAAAFLSPISAEDCSKCNINVPESVYLSELISTGTWQGWSLGGRTPSNLVTARFGAACLLRQLQAQKYEEHVLPGLSGPGPKVLRREIAVFQPGFREFLTCPIDADASLSADGDGGVRVEGRGRLSLAGGRLQIAPVPRE